MTVGHDKRSEETKKNIISAAQQLFSSHGYERVTMRQIAKEAKCSHTTIYIYFKDKEELLHILAMPLLQELYQKLKAISQLEILSPENKLKEMSRAFIRFSFENKNMYPLLIGSQSIRVDEEETELQINRVRLDLFKCMQDTLQSELLSTDPEQLLEFARIFFYTLHGIITTYINSKESYSELVKRLGSTFDASVDVLLLGFKTKEKKGGAKNEG